MEHTFRPCDGCNACCEGHLIGEAFGYNFYPSKPCFFLKEKRCSIHLTRPHTCKKYQCAWSQNMFDENMRPDKCGLLVSIEYDINKKQYFKVMEILERIDYSAYNTIKLWTEQLDTYYVIIPFRRSE